MRNNKPDYQGEPGTARIHWLGGLFAVMTLILLFRMFHIQVLAPDPWRAMAPAQYESRIKLAAKRGMIFDRQKNLLAMDLPGYSLAADPGLVSDTQKTAEAISQILGGHAQGYQKLLENGRGSRFVRISDHINEEQRHLFRAQGLRELMVQPERNRSYPFEDLAKPLLGITDLRHEGVAGVELACNDFLSGQDGWTILQRDGKNRNFSTVDYPLEPALDGKHVVLTIDYIYQTMIEEELKKGLSRCEAKWGSAVLMHPVTGEILAMASLAGPRLHQENPDFQTLIRNHCIQDNYEPGSVFKVVTLAAALEEGIMNPQSLIYCENGHFMVNGNKIGDDHRAFKWLTLKEAMQVSSNIAMSKIVKQLGRETFYRYVQNFGFGNRSGIGLPGEAAGFLRPPYQWDDFLTATSAFGQGLSVTTLQLASMVSVIANGGQLMKPTIIRAVLDEDGRVIERSQPKMIRRVLSEETARMVAEIMESTVTEGTGKKAAVHGLRLAGKTGTAQKSVPGVQGYLPGTYVSSFVGFWPVNSPEFVLIVTLDEPRHETPSSQSAAPIFAGMAEQISGLPGTPRIPEPVIKPSSVFTMSSLETGQPAVETIETASQQISPFFVPDMVGLSIRQAMRKLAVCKIEAVVTGHGIVLSQNLKPGLRVQKNMICRLQCE